MLTASADGHVKFWKKKEEDVEFVKHFKAHLGTYVAKIFLKSSLIPWINAMQRKFSTIMLYHFPTK